MTNEPQPPQDTAWLVDVLETLVSAVAPDEDGHSKYDDADTQLEVEEEATEEAKAAILTHLNTGQSNPQPLEDGELRNWVCHPDDADEHLAIYDDNLGGCPDHPFASGCSIRKETLMQLFKAELERREREATVEALQRVQRKIMNLTWGGPRGAQSSSEIVSEEIAQLTPTPESKQNEETE